MVNGVITYEYKCTKCGAVVERRYRFGKNPPSVECDKCGAEARQHFGTPVAIHFVGWDWTRKDLLDPLDPRNDRPLDFSDVEPDEPVKVFT